MAERHFKSYFWVLRLNGSKSLSAFGPNGFTSFVKPMRFTGTCVCIIPTELSLSAPHALASAEALNLRNENR